MDIPGVEESKGGDSEDIDFYDNTVPLPKMPQKSYKTNTRRKKRVFQPLAAQSEVMSAPPVTWSERSAPSILRGREPRERPPGQKGPRGKVSF